MADLSDVVERAAISMAVGLPAWHFIMSGMASYYQRESPDGTMKTYKERLIDKKNIMTSTVTATGINIVHSLFYYFSQP